MGMIAETNKSTNRKDYLKKYHKIHIKNKFGFPEPKIKDVAEYIENIKKYPANFPVEEFGETLDKMLKNNPPEIKEKNLKDLIYDILDKKDLLTPRRIITVYHDLWWANSIEKLMKERNYTKDGDDKYVKLQE